MARDGDSTARLGRGQPALRFFTIRDISESLDVSTRTVRRWVQTGVLRAHRIGGVLRVSEADLMTFLAARRTA
jgi:excisionase family DNA binding protein